MTDETPKPPGPLRRDYFDDSDVSRNMSGNIVRGSAYLGGASVARFLMNIVSTVILARLLDPEAYGLLAMVFVVTNFLVLFRDMNLSLATVQRAKITHAQVSTIFWVNVMVSAVIAAAIAALAPGIAWFYGEPRLTLLALVLALPIFMRGFIVQHKALLRRKMNFAALTGIDLTSAFFGYVVAIVMAWLGYGYWSLVGMQIGSTVFDLLLTLYVTRWWPGLPVRGSGVRSMVVFGSNLTGYSVIRFASRSLDNLLIGSYWGAASLGIYSKSRDLVGQVSGYAQSPFSAVGVPSLSRLTDEPEKYRRTFHRLSEKIALVAVGSAVLIGCTAPEVVAILLGEKWTAAAPILQVIAVLIASETIFQFVNWLFISQGRGGQLLKLGACDAAVRAVSVIVGLQWGIMGIAYALALTGLFVHMPFHIWYACREGPVRQRDVYRMLAPIMAGAAAAVVAIMVVQRLLPLENPFAVIVVSGVVMVLVEGIFLLTTAAGRQTLWDLRRGLEILFRRGAKSAE